MESSKDNFNNINESPNPNSDETNLKAIASTSEDLKMRSNSHSPNQSIKKRSSSLEGNKRNQNETKNYLKKDFILFRPKTSMRGVARMVKSTDKKFLILWLGFFVILCLGLMVCMVLLLKQYFEYDVIHSPRVLSNMYTPFPSLTVCNLRPLSANITSFMAEHKLRNPREFATRLNAYAINRYLYRNMNAEYQSSTVLVSMAGYLESMKNISFIHKLGHTLEDMVISCKITFADGSKYFLTLCSSAGKWRTILHPQYINCYSFDLNKEFSTKTVTVELFVYLAEEVNTTACIDCFLNNMKSQLSGALLVVHKAGSYPDINQESINLQPGTLTEVNVKTIKNIMKTPPYGKCSRAAQEVLSFSHENYTYSEMVCKFGTFQRIINEECKCAAIDFPLINNISLPFCTALPHFVSHNSCPEIDKRNINISLDRNCVSDLENAVARSICKNNITKRYHGDGIQGCYLPCSFYSYETDRSVTTWPTKSYHLGWINSYTARRLMYKPELNIYKRALELLKNGNEAAAYEILSNQNILEKKLVGVLINKPNYNLHVVEEKEVLSFTSFLIQFVCLFSIWIGLTLINIVEIIEMIIRMGDNKGVNNTTDIYDKDANLEPLVKSNQLREAVM